MVSTWVPLRGSVNLLLDKLPEGVNAQPMRFHLLGLPGVIRVHDLHTSSLSATETAMTAHPSRPG